MVFDRERRWIGECQMGKPIGRAQVQDRLMAVPPFGHRRSPPLLLGQVAYDGGQCRSLSLEIVTDLVHAVTLARTRSFGRFARAQRAMAASTSPRSAWTVAE